MVFVTVDGGIFVHWSPGPVNLAMPTGPGVAIDAFPLVEYAGLSVHIIYPFWVIDLPPQNAGMYAAWAPP